MNRPAPTALIAEDEPLLAAALQAELARAWPDLQMLATVGDGHSAVTKTLELQPDVLFFDIQMPGQSGLDAAFALLEEWPELGLAQGTGKPFPTLVFVTAYDQYAVQAFEAQAVDYLLKPINHSRLIVTVNKLQSSLVNKSQTAPDFDVIFNKLTSLNLLRSKIHVEKLSVIQASVGAAIHLVKVADVVCFEAADKYVRVLTRPSDAKPAREYLIRTPLKDLLPQLDESEFWQVHRGTVVRAECIERATRDEAGKLWLALEGLDQKVAVSRVYAHLFRAM